GVAIDKPFSLACLYKLGETSPSANRTLMSRQLASGTFAGWSWHIRGTSAGDPYRLALVGSGFLQVEFPRTDDAGWHVAVVTYDGSVTAAGIKAYEDGNALTPTPDRKSTRLNSSHVKISYAVFCLKKKK